LKISKNFTLLSSITVSSVLVINAVKLDEGGGGGGNVVSLIEDLRKQK
jgi:hypothetical protein